MLKPCIRSFMDFGDHCQLWNMRHYLQDSNSFIVYSLQRRTSQARETREVKATTWPQTILFIKSGHTRLTIGLCVVFGYVLLI